MNHLPKYSKLKFSFFQQVPSPYFKIKPGQGNNLGDYINYKKKEIDSLFFYDKEYNNQLMNRTFSSFKKKKFHKQNSNDEKKANKTISLNHTQYNRFFNKKKKNYYIFEDEEQLIPKNLLKSKIKKDNNNNIPNSSYNKLNRLNNKTKNNLTIETSSFTSSNINHFDNMSYDKEQNLPNKSNLNNFFLTSYKFNDNINKSRNFTVTINKKKLPKKHVDFSNLNLSPKKTHISYDNKTNKSRRNSILEKEENNLKTILIKSKINDVEKKVPIIKSALKGVLKDSHYFPMISPAFQKDIGDIIDTKIKINNNATYNFQKFDDKNYSKISKNYWNYTEEKKINKKVFSYQKKKLQFIKNQIRGDIIDVKKFQVNIKTGEI